MGKLDSFSKILLATQSINYMANIAHSVNQQIKGIPDPQGIFKPGIKHRDELLKLVVSKLGEVMNELGHCLNNADSVSPIDERITKQAFDIIIHGKDNVEI